VAATEPVTVTITQISNHLHGNPRPSFAQSSRIQNIPITWSWIF